MLQFTPINTQRQLSATETDYALARLGPLANTARGMPICLIDPDLMDRLYPQHKLMSLDLECVREIITQIEEPPEEREDTLGKLLNVDRERLMLDALWDRLGRCKREIDRGSVVVAVGLYLSDASEAAQICPEHADLLPRSGPAVFISPERVNDWARKLNATSHFKTLFAKIYYHELCHALVDDRSQKYGTDWGRVLEESLCNAVAFSRFQTDSEKAFLTRAIAQQPSEYRGYTVFSEGPFCGPHGLIAALQHIDPHWIFWWEAEWRDLIDDLRHMPRAQACREFSRRWAQAFPHLRWPPPLPWFTAQSETPLDTARQWRDSGNSMPEIWQAIGLEVMRRVAWEENRLDTQWLPQLSKPKTNQTVIVRGMKKEMFIDHFKDMVVYFGGDPRAVPREDAKYIGFYLEAPDSAITHIGIVSSVEHVSNGATFHLKAIIKLDKPVRPKHQIRKHVYMTLNDLGIQHIALVFNNFSIEGP